MEERLGGWGWGRMMQQRGQELLGTTEGCQTLTAARGKLDERHPPLSAQAQKHSALQERALFGKFTPVPPMPARAERQRADTKTC